MGVTTRANAKAAPAPPKPSKAKLPKAAPGAVPLPQGAPSGPAGKRVRTAKSPPKPHPTAQLPFADERADSDGEASSKEPLTKRMAPAKSAPAPAASKAVVETDGDKVKRIANRDMDRQEAKNKDTGDTLRVEPAAIIDLANDITEQVCPFPFSFISFSCALRAGPAPSASTGPRVTSGFPVSDPCVR